MKICDLCRKEVAKLIRVILLNDEREFYEKDSCPKCYDSLPNNYLEVWFTFYPFARCLDMKLAKKSLEDSAFWKRFAEGFQDVGYPWADRSMDKALGKVEGDREKIKLIHILKRNKALRKELNHITCNFEFRKNYNCDRLIDGGGENIWRYGWSSCDDAKHRFSLLNYQTRYQIIFHLYLHEDIEILKELIFKELSAVKDRVIKMVDHIKCENLNKYWSFMGRFTKEEKEAENLNKRHQKIFDQAIDKICKR